MLHVFAQGKGESLWKEIEGLGWNPKGGSAGAVAITSSPESAHINQLECNYNSTTNILSKIHQPTMVSMKSICLIMAASSCSLLLERVGE